MAANNAGRVEFQDMPITFPENTPEPQDFQGTRSLISYEDIPDADVIGVSRVLFDAKFPTVEDKALALPLLKINKMVLHAVGLVHHPIDGIAHMLGPNCDWPHVRAFKRRMRNALPLYYQSKSGSKVLNYVIRSTCVAFAQGHGYRPKEGTYVHSIGHLRSYKGIRR